MNLLTVPNTENLFLKMQFMSRKIYVSNYKYVCLLLEEYTKITQSYKLVQPNKNMNVSFVVLKINYDTNKNKGRIINKIWDGKKRWGWCF